METENKCKDLFMFVIIIAFICQFKKWENWTGLRLLNIYLLIYFETFVLKLFCLMTYVRSSSSSVFIYSIFVRSNFSHLFIQPVVSSTFYEMDDATNVYVQENGKSRSRTQKSGLVPPFLAIWIISVNCMTLSCTLSRGHNIMHNAITY